MCETEYLSLDAYRKLLDLFPAFKSYIESVARLRLRAIVRAPNSRNSILEQSLQANKKGAFDLDDLSLGELFHASNPAARAMLRQGIKEMEDFEAARAALEDGRGASKKKQRSRERSEQLKRGSLSSIRGSLDGLANTLGKALWLRAEEKAAKKMDAGGITRAAVAAARRV